MRYSCFRIATRLALSGMIDIKAVAGAGWRAIPAEMAALVQAKDWEQTLLGAQDLWSPSLCLAT